MGKLGKVGGRVGRTGLLAAPTTAIGPHRLRRGHGLGLGVRGANRRRQTPLDAARRSEWGLGEHVDLFLAGCDTEAAEMAVHPERFRKAVMRF